MAPPIRVISKTQYANEMAAAAGTPSEEQAVLTKALQMMGLLPPDSTVASAASASSEDNIVAYYDPDSKRVTIVNQATANDPVGDIIELAHEFTHALQDQDFGIDSYRAERDQSLDSFVAVTSLIEGEATVLGYAVAARSQGRTPQELDWSYASVSLWNSIFQSVDASAAPLITAAQLLPYPLGTDYISARWLTGGQRKIDAIYANPPLSVLDWRNSVNPGKPSLVQALNCYPTTPPEGYTAFNKDTLGITGALAVRMHAGEVAEQAWANIQAWRGDSLVVFKGVSDTDVAVAWRTRWATANDAADAVSALDQLGDTVATHRSVVDGNEVTLLLGANSMLLNPWATAMQCGTESELPGSPDAGPAAPSAAWRRLISRVPARHFGTN